jgi:pepF/M3 family oligoendopeptidase
MAVIYPAIDSPEFAAAFDSYANELDRIARLFDEMGVRRRDHEAVDAATVAAYEDITRLLNDLGQQARTLGSYVGCFTSTDASDEEAQKAESLLHQRYVLHDQLSTRYVAWVGTMDLEALLAGSETARDHERTLRRARYSAERQMAEGEEILASELRPSGISAWARLHGEMSALLSAEVDLPEGRQTLPIAKVRSLANEGDRAVRRAGYEAELEAWKRVEVPLAAALNGVKGFQQVLRKRRGYADDVEPTLMSNGIDRPTLDAMQRACVETFPDFRRYFRAKARLLGLEKLEWYDLFAPVGSLSRRYTWAEAEEVVALNFGVYSERMEAFARRSYAEQWIDAEPRMGKEGGAYCTGILPGVSRIMMNFDGSFSNVSTLAHELGHAYHNLNMVGRTSLQRESPMTLNETASIFCETLLFEAALAEAEGEEKLVLLDTSLQRDSQTVVDIHSRFLFESRVFEQRAQRDLSVSEFKELMVQAQRETYGDGLASYHAYMWAVKGHYYGPLFYNYPYTFGMLFATGLYARYKQGPEAFRANYDAFLSRTGMADARTLASTFGIDTADVAFWRSSLDQVRDQIAEFERLAAEKTA